MNRIQNDAARNLISAYRDQSLTMKPGRQFTLDPSASAEMLEVNRRDLASIIAEDETDADIYHGEPGNVRISYSKQLSQNVQQHIDRSVEYQVDGDTLKCQENLQFSNRHDGGYQDHNGRLSSFEIGPSSLDRISVVDTPDGGLLAMVASGTAEAITCSYYNVPANELLEWRLAR